MGDMYRDLYRLRLDGKLDAGKVKELFVKQASIQAEIYLEAAPDSFRGKAIPLLAMYKNDPLAPLAA